MRKVLFLALFSVILSASTFGANPIERFFGNWAFQKAEYYEATPQKGMQLAHTITAYENMRQFEQCATYAICELDISGGMAFATTINNKVQGYCSISTLMDNPDTGLLIITGNYGFTEPQRNTDTIPSQEAFNQYTFQHDYKIELIDDNTLAVTTEYTCGSTPSMIKCIMRKVQ